MNSPLLFLVFNRPSTTKKVFETIKKAQPPRLYIAADGPRINKEGDQLLCEEVKKIILDIDWKCEVKTLFREQNLGCKRAVSEGIDWFFQHEAEGIILEDDVLPLPTFFQYCDELLDKYRDDEHIGIITGNNLISKRLSIDESYFFSHYPNIWGWATWKRVWQHYDVDMNEWSKWKKTSSLKTLSDGMPFFRAYWIDQIDAIYKGKMDTWDFQLFFTCWRLNTLCIVPKNNLTENLGFGNLATHTTGSIPDCVVESIVEDLSFPLIHPLNVFRHKIADRLINERVFDIRLFTLVKWKVRRIPLVGLFLSEIRKMFKL